MPYPYKPIAGLSSIQQDLEQARAILADVRLSAAEKDSYLSAMVVDPILTALEERETFERSGSCCCSSHPPDRTFTVEITIHPHGYRMKRIGPVKEQLGIQREILGSTEGPGRGL